MNCEVAREAISATLDGERPQVEPAQLEEHIEGCAACRAWREQAHAVTRRTRLAVARPVPAPSPPLLAAIGAGERSRRRTRALAPARLGLLLVALAQIAFNLSDLLAGTYRDAPIHVAHEMGALDIALAIGFFAAAWRPARAQGMRALVGCAALLLLVTAVLDILAGHTTLADEAPHLLVIVGWLLLRHTARLSPREQDGGLAFPLPARVRTMRRLPAPIHLRDVDPPAEEWRRDDATVPGTVPLAGEGSSSMLVPPPEEEATRMQAAGGA